MKFKHKISKGFDGEVSFRRNGTTTICVLKNAAEDTVVEVAQSRVHPLDTFNKKTGRLVAFRNLMSNLTPAFDRKRRAGMWTAFREMEAQHLAQQP